MGADEARISMAARILLIDPDPVLCNFLAELLRRAGHSVRQIDTVDLAVRQLWTAAVDIVVTDPNRTANESSPSFESLRSTFPGPTFIAISAAPHSTGYLRLAATLGAGALLAEPYLSRDLWDLVAVCLRT